MNEAMYKGSHAIRLLKIFLFFYFHLYSVYVHPMYGIMLISIDNQLLGLMSKFDEDY